MNLLKKVTAIYIKLDSEVIVSLIEWKEKALLKFNGMFAFSFWDEDLKILLLGRDRYRNKTSVLFK